MYEIDDEARRFLKEAEAIYWKQRKNVEHLLGFAHGSESIDEVFGVNIFACGAELLVLQIFQNLKQGFLLISLVALRVLFEIYINVHYIFQHPQHLRDRNWAIGLCEDYSKRSDDPKANKGKLGNTSLFCRAKETGRETYYHEVYSELSDYSHFMTTILKDLDQRFVKAQLIRVALYTTFFYQDLLMALASFYDCNFEANILYEIDTLKEKGIRIISDIK